MLICVAEASFILKILAIIKRLKGFDQQAKINPRPFKYAPNPQLAAVQN